MQIRYDLFIQNIVISLSSFLHSLGGHSMTTDNSVALDRKKQNRHLYQLVAGKTISDIGSFLDMVALNVYALLLTNSSLEMGLIMAARLLAGILASFYSGILADRMNRKTLMIFSDVIRSVALFALIVSPHDYKVWMLFLVSFAQGWFGSMFGVALSSSIPVIVGAENRVRANSLMQSLSSIAMIIGLVTSGTLLGLVSYNTIFIIDACSYLLSAANLISLPIQTNEARVGGVKKNPLLEEIRTTFGYVRTMPILLSVMTIRLVDALGSSSHNVGMPVFSKLLDPDRPSFYMGIIWAAWALGNLIGGVTIARYLKARNNEALNERAFGIATFFMSVFFIAIFWANTIYLLIPFAIIAGFWDGICTICFTSRVQQVPDEKRGRVFGVVSTFSTVGFGLGMVICSPLFDHYKPAVIVSYMHGLPMVMSLVFTIIFFSKWQTKASAKAAAATAEQLDS
ncbi:MAG: MFS transporter [Tumebacillaceae bacterium]